MGIIGHYAKADQATLEKELLSFARVMAGVPIKKVLPNYIEFLDEWGLKVMLEIQYEWRPAHCDNCGDRGHDTEKCKRLLGVRKVWIPKATTRTAARPEHADHEGFIAPRHTAPAAPVANASPAVVATTNVFQSLHSDAPEPPCPSEPNGDGEQVNDKHFGGTGGWILVFGMFGD